MTKPSRRLVQEWHKKLRDSGFQDIEYPDKATGYKDWLKPDIQKAPESAGNTNEYGDEKSRAKLIHGAIREYYILAEHYLNYRKWARESVLKVIWRLHSEGKSSRTISAVLELDRNFIRRQLERLEADFMVYVSEQRDED